MNVASDISAPDTSASETAEDVFVDKRGHKGPERRCLASGENRLKTDMIRFVLSPDKVVTPDIMEKLPGRGVWVSADKASLEKAVATKSFARGFKSQVQTPDGLIQQVTDLLKRRVLGLLAMGMKSGDIILGFDQVKSAAQGDYLAWRIEASDGSEDGRGKIRVLTKAVSRELERPMTSILGCFSAEELGKALGREHIVHAALRAGPLSKALRQAAYRLSGFQALIPEDWPDKSHEVTQG